MHAQVGSERVRFVAAPHADGRRLLAVLDPTTLRTYTRRVASIAPQAEAALSPRVIANRVATCSMDPLELRLRPWRSERDAFTTRLSELVQRADTLAFVDVHRCYASISPAVVGATLRRFGAEESDAVESFLRGLEAHGVRGLPVGPDPSAVLANIVLRHADRRLEDIGSMHLRWVDDFVLACTNPATALLHLRRALAEIGLRLNEAKTKLIVGSQADMRGVGPLSDRAGRASL